MIISETFYGVKCNRCGETYNDGEHSFWDDESSAVENAMESEWIEEKGKHYCPKCHSTNEDTDEIIIYEPFPKHLVTLNKFIDKVTSGYYRSVLEPDNRNVFIVQFNIHHTNSLEEHEHDFVKSLLGENLISIEYEKGKYSGSTGKITFSK